MSVIDKIKACRLCAAHLPLGPRPVFQISSTAKILIAAQAPGIRVHNSGRPFTDPSGERLRDWMGIDETIFYDPVRTAIVPMGFCYPGTGVRGDMPPRPECAPTWRKALLSTIEDLRLTLVIGQYAHAWHLGRRRGKTLTETVKNWQAFAGDNIIPLPHPSPRNNIWLRKNPWFEDEVLPVLRARVSAALQI